MTETCKWYVSIDEPECGKPAIGTAVVTGKLLKATVPLCARHKADHDRSYAKMRTAGRAV